MTTDLNNNVAVLEEGIIASLTGSPPEDNRRVTYDIAPAAIFKILFTLASILLFQHVFPVLLMIVLSLMLVATFNPLVRKLQARLGRSWAIMGVVTGLVVIFLGTLALLIPPLISQGINLFEHAPVYARQIEKVLVAHHMHVNVERQVTRFVNSFTTSEPKMMAVLSPIVAGITGFVTVGILTIYLLIEGPQVGLAVMRLLPRKERLRARKLALDIGVQVGGYMRGQMITSALAGTFAFVTLLLLGIPGALALGALAAIADAIPLIGVIIALLPAALIALTVSPSKAGIVVVAYLVYRQLEDSLIGPKIYGSTLGLSLSVIVISILIGVELMGMMGAVLALPVAAAIPTIIAYIQEWQDTHSAPETTPTLP